MRHKAVPQGTAFSSAPKGPHFKTVRSGKDPCVVWQPVRVHRESVARQPAQEARTRSPAMAEPMISANRLTRVLDRVKGVDAPTTEIAQGEIFGLLGHKGAGKTTTVQMLATQLRPTAVPAR